MYTKTRNNRKKRLKRTNTTKLPEISEATETKLPVNFTLQDSKFYSRFAFFRFFRSFQGFYFGCLDGVAFILETRFRFASSSF